MLAIEIMTPRGEIYLKRGALSIVAVKFKSFQQELSNRMKSYRWKRNKLSFLKSPLGDKLAPVGPLKGGAT